MILEQIKQQHDIIIKMETEFEGEEENTEEQLTHTQTETTSQTEAETENDESGSEDSSEEDEVVNKFVDNPGNVHNRWSGKFKINEFHEDKPVITDAFRKAFDERKRKQKEICLLNGWEECDVTDCFCKSEESLGPGKQVANNHKPANSAISKFDWYIYNVKTMLKDIIPDYTVRYSDESGIQMVTV